MINKDAIQKALGKGIGTCLAAQRKKVGLTQGELAEKAGVDTETISRFERGATMPSLVTLQILASELDTTMAELIGESSPIPNDQAKTIAGWLAALKSEDRVFVMDILKKLCARMGNDQK